MPTGVLPAEQTWLAILRTLMGGERNVSQVVDETGRNQTGASFPRKAA